MQTDASRAVAIRAAFSKLIDYAGLFPPARLAMQPAIAEYTAERRGPFSWMLGRYISPASRVPELLDALPAGDEFSLSVIADTGIDALAQIAHWRKNEPSIRIEALEVVLQPAHFQAFADERKSEALDNLPAFVEFPREGDWHDNLPANMSALASAGLGAKVRCGGLEAGAFPSPSELAIFIQSACDAGVPFKATAGLHHPVRHLDAATGFTMHGFLNLLAATALARGSDTSRQRVVEALSSENADDFQVDERGLCFKDDCIGVAELSAMRTQAFIAYGSCSFSEPVQDLRGLNLL